MLSRSRNPRLTFLLIYDVWVTSKIQVNFRFERYWWFCLMNFLNFHTIHVFEVRESIADISTELPCLGDLENPGRLPVQPVLGGTGQICSKFISSRAKVVGRSHVRLTLYCQLYCHVTSCHVMSRHVMSRHITSCHVMSRHVMSRHVTSCHVMSRHVTSCHVMSRHVTSCHVMSRHVTSCHVMSRRKWRDGHTTNALLSTDFFHTQLIQIRHNRVRWLSRRVPIPYRISGI